MQTPLSLIKDESNDKDYDRNYGEGIWRWYGAQNSTARNISEAIFNDTDAVLTI